MWLLPSRERVAGRGRRVRGRGVPRRGGCVGDSCSIPPRIRKRRAPGLAADRIRHTVMWSAPTRQNNTLTAKKGKRHDRRREGSRHSCRRLFLVPGGGIRRPQGRGFGGVRLHGRKDGEPEVRGGMLGRDGPCRSRPTHV